jgi:primosomal protein N''
MPLLLLGDENIGDDKQAAAVQGKRDSYGSTNVTFNKCLQQAHQAVTKINTQNQQGGNFKICTCAYLAQPMLWSSRPPTLP